MQNIDYNNKSHLRRIYFTCRIYGIQPSYYNPQKEIQWSSPWGLLKGLEIITQQKIAFIEDLMGLQSQFAKTKYDNGLATSLAYWQGEIKILDVYLLESETSDSLTFRSQQGWSMTLTPEKLKSLKVKNKLNYGHYKIPIENIPLGYHNIEVQTNERLMTSFWISAPEKLIPKSKRSWGIFAPLYGLRSKKDWGIGSFNELKDLSNYIKNYGAQWIGTLPLLACDYSKAENDPSPYSSLTRLFWNEIYLDIEPLIEQSSRYQNQNLLEEETKKEIQNLRNSQWVNYFQIYQIKSKILTFLALEFFDLKKDQEPDFQHFLSENPQIQEYAQFRSQTKDQNKFHLYVQYQLDQQLKQFKGSTDLLGLYLDYPVGVSESGFDFYKYRSNFIPELQAGAPPEPMYPDGQNWGFPPLHFENLSLSGFEYFQTSLKAHMKYTQMLRIDHIMGFYRIYVIPKDYNGRDGFYLRYGKEELFAIAVLEAHKNQVQLIGENLGVVPKAVDHILLQRQIYGMWIYYMDAHALPEKSMDSIHPHQLIGVNTHDMPPFAAFYYGEEHNPSYLQKWKDFILKTLKEKTPEYFENRKIDENHIHVETFYNDLLKFLTIQNSEYLIFNPEDSWLETQSQNQPGKSKYENWRRKLNYPLEHWNNNSYVTKSFEILKKAYCEKNI